MPHKPFEQQVAAQSFSIPKSAALPQHGQKADAKVIKVAEQRTFRPRPGH